MIAVPTQNHPHTVGYAGNRCIFLMLLSRHRWIDDWNWPWSLVILYSLHVAILLICAILLRANSENARREALERLRIKMRSLCHQDKSEKDIRHIKHAIDDIRELRVGAFSSFGSNPILRAVLIPSGGWTLVGLLEMWVRS